MWIWIWILILLLLHLLLHLHLFLIIYCYLTHRSLLLLLLFTTLKLFLGCRVKLNSSIRWCLWITPKILICRKLALIRSSTVKLLLLVLRRLIELLSRLSKLPRRSTTLSNVWSSLESCRCHTWIWDSICWHISSLLLMLVVLRSTLMILSLPFVLII
jgi:hypothetical protein